MKKYIHKVNYYETDKMGVTHHSNYIRWMEEARIDYLNQIGLGYKKLEEEGIISPVIHVECDYKVPTTFDDKIEIEVKIEEFKGVKLRLKYIFLSAPFLFITDGSPIYTSFSSSYVDTTITVFSSPNIALVILTKHIPIP